MNISSAQTACVPKELLFRDDLDENDGFAQNRVCAVSFPEFKALQFHVRPICFHVLSKKLHMVRLPARIRRKMYPPLSFVYERQLIRMDNLCVVGFDLPGYLERVYENIDAGFLNLPDHPV